MMLSLMETEPVEIVLKPNLLRWEPEKVEGVAMNVGSSSSAEPPMKKRRTSEMTDLPDGRQQLTEW